MMDHGAAGVRLGRNTACAALILAAAFEPASGFELTPLPTRAERFIAEKAYGIKFRVTYPLVDFALHRFSTPVHEALTQLAYECPDSIDSCATADLDFAGTGVIAGVRWNDDPPFQFTSGSGKYPGCPAPAPSGAPRTISFALSVTCWLQHFKDVESIASRSPATYADGSGTLLARTHFGDLQFLHAMATRVDEDPNATLRRMLMWAELAWRLQPFAIDVIEATTRMGEVSVAGLSTHFPATEQRTVAELFTVGRPWLRLQLADVAFGSLLHVVQDSFSGGHALRRPRTSDGCARSEIVNFHTYAGQNKQQHKLSDTIGMAGNQVELGEALRTLVLLRFQRKQWPEVRSYLSECAFRLATDAKPATSEVSPR